MRLLGILMLGVVGGVLALALLTLGGGFLYLRGSLPPLSGDRAVEGITAEVLIERDSLGVPAIRAGSLRDAIFAQGFVHGQDRFLQMDLLRRLVSGEMAELMGEAAVSADLQYRPYGYRRAAELHLANLHPSDRELLNAYVDGVNRGLASLGRRPPEYVLLGSRPEPWTAVDSLLGFLYFYLGLSTHYREERHLRTLYAVLPAELADFLTPDDSRFDSPVVGATADDPTGGYRPRPIPGPGVVDLRNVEVEGGAGGPIGQPEPLTAPLPVGGSNAWAVRGEDGRTLLANDPHLALTVPGIWYRVALEWDGGMAIGVSPPGLPGVFAGMNHSLAWGVTAAVVDQTDLVEVELDTDDPLRYRTVEGWDTLVVRNERIRVRGGDTREREVHETRWGPIVFSGHDGVPLALRSPAMDPGGVTMRQLALLQAEAMEDFTGLLSELGGPGLSIVLADDEGRIGWMISGVLPRRTGFSGRRPVSFAVPGVGWAGVVDEEERPLVIRDEPGTFHTANQRPVEVARARDLSHYWMSPVRARRIDDRIGETLPVDIESNHALQLDTRSLLHEPFRDHALAVLEGDELDPLLESLRDYLLDWDGTADADAPHFRIMVRVGQGLMDAVLAPLLEPVREQSPSFRYDWPLSHEPALRILDERPPHFLPAGHDEWDDYLLASLRTVAEGLARTGSAGLGTTWGEVNRYRIQHPFGQISGAVGRFVNLPRAPAHGWTGTVRAATPGHGQSFRMVARPGEPSTATFQMPGGQSGHPLSRFYQAGHRAWLEGRPAPLAPGPARHTLTLRPPGS